MDVSVLSITPSPDFFDDRMMFAGTLDDGILRSTDGGATWVPKNEGFSFRRASTIVPSPLFATDFTLFAGTFGVLFRSDDRGESWRQVNQ